MSARCFGVCSDISIHAPTRGATDMNPDNDQIIHNFNPRSHERSDHERISQFKLLAYFNPRSHERSDSTSSASYSFCTNFNPRSHERSDIVRLIVVMISLISIHAPTRGATEFANIIKGEFCKFQSTLPREERRV